MLNEEQIAFSTGEIRSGFWLSGVFLFFYLVIEI
jgi:hypothetical protein